MCLRFARVYVSDPCTCMCVPLRVCFVCLCCVCVCLCVYLWWRVVVLSHMAAQFGVTALPALAIVDGKGGVVVVGSD